MLTERQGRAVRALRSKNMGYKTIAAQLGINRDAVRNYCVKYGLDGLRGGQPAEPEMLCPYCGEEVIQPKRGRRRKFCSRECCYRWWVENPELVNRKPTAFYTATCAHCGKEFTAYGNDHRRYCSRDCYIQHRFGNAKTQRHRLTFNAFGVIYDVPKAKED